MVDPVPDTDVPLDPSQAKGQINYVPRRLAVLGKGMLNNNALLSSVLQANIQRWYPWSALQGNKTPPDAFIGWGSKKSYRRASRVARRKGVPALSIEDGFLRSLDSGVTSKYGMSVVVDDLGIYFDLHHPSRLEYLVVENCIHWCDDQTTDSRAMMAKLSRAELSKYNVSVSSPSLNERFNTPRSNRALHPSSHVLLVDQVQGDASIAGSGASIKQFKRMLKMACQQHPNAAIWIKAHPAGKKGYLTGLRLPKQVQILADAVNPIALLKQVDHVYTVSSHMGFEALMLGKTVHCFGVSWYSGWGLTDDSHAPKRLLKRVQKRRLKLLSQYKRPTNSARGFNRLPNINIEQLFNAAYTRYSRYADPASGQSCDLTSVINWLVSNRDWQHKLSGPLTIYEFSRWKLPFVKDFVGFPNTELFIKPKPRLKNLLHPDHFRMNYHYPVLVWGLGKRQQLQNKLQKKAVAIQPPIYCMEDGFIRSNGLGATLLAPLSVVIDQQGIYYDATQPSDLEQLLIHCPQLTSEERQRVSSLWDQLLTQRVSKYNVGDRNNSASVDSLLTSKVGINSRVLIVGQVEDDLSVQYCGSVIKSNAALIQRVRQDYPDAYLIYKPHPDVEAGLRAGKVDSRTLALVDYVAHKAAMPDCLDIVDEVHTISSLTGFEALLRDLKVVCYGLPFYAGWGLTTEADADKAPISGYLKRRQRIEPLSMEQLIYCTLIQYPLYRLPDGYGLAQVEQVIDYLYPNHKTTQSNSLGNLEVNNGHRSHKSKDHGVKIAPTITRHFEASNQLVKTRFMQWRHRLLGVRKRILSKVE